MGSLTKEFRTILLKMFNELYEHTEEQPNEISCTMQKEMKNTTRRKK